MIRMLLLLEIVVMVTIALLYVGRSATRRSDRQQRRIRELEEQVDILANQELQREEERRG